MIYQELEDYLKAFHQRQNYTAKTLYPEIIQLDPIIVQDEQGFKYNVLINYNLKFEIGQQLVLKDYKFCLDYDLDKRLLKNATLKTDLIKVELKAQLFSTDIHEYALRATLINQFKPQIMQHNLVDLYQKLDIQQQGEQQKKQNSQHPQRQPLKVFFKQENENQLKQEEQLKFIQVEDAEESIENQNPNSNIKVPPNWQDEVQEWVESNKKTKKQNHEYLKKLELLSQSLSKKHVLENMVQYPHKPLKSVARQMLHILLDQDLIEKHTKKQKIS